MDVALLRIFQRQVALQCRFILMAAQEINVGLQQRNVERVFYEIQNLLNAGANVSKALWGQGGRLANERKPLRDSIGIGDDSPLRQVAMRNNFEHFDERLDRWWNQSTHHNSIDLMIGPNSAIAGVADIDRFRAFDPLTAKMNFWGQDFNVQVIVDEVQKILPRLQDEANKPHWEVGRSPSQQ